MHRVQADQKQPLELLAEEVILEMHKDEMVTLPVHDSFMVRKGNQEWLRSAMERAFVDQVGEECEIKADETELDEHRQIYGPDKDHGSLVRTNNGLLRGELFDGMVKDWTNQQPEIHRGYWT